MAERSRPPADPELEAALQDLGAGIAFPPTPDLAPALRARLAAGQAGGGRPPRPRPAALLPRRPWQRAALALLAALLAIAALLALSPAARASLGGWLRLRGVLIVLAPAQPAPTPPPVGAPLQLGRRLTLAEAQRRVAFRILTPRQLGAPDEVYLGLPPPGGQVALVYRPRPGLPRAPNTGVGLLLTEFQATLEPFFFKKVMMMGTQLQEFSIDGAPAYWISGPPHLFGYTGAGGQFAVERLRLAGNTLLWQEGPLTLRLEGMLPRDLAVRIASSLR